MDAKTWLIVREWLADLAELPESEWDPYLEGHCSDLALRKKVRAMRADAASLSGILIRAALESGVRIGPYEIVEPIDVGGMGEVYRARDLTLPRDVAIKVLPVLFAEDRERLGRLYREAQVLASLNHPNIVTIHSVERTDGLLCLAMEYVEGHRLSDVIVKGGLPLAKLLNLAIPLADAISAAHQKGITHRDLKPANVMVTAEGRVKVLDFGVAKLIEASPAVVGADGSAVTALTDEGRIVGTVAYMSPEQAEGKPIDHRSDIFSLGTLMYEMATGERPFTGETNLAVLSAIVKDTPRSVTDVNPTVPREFARVVKRCLAKEVSRRYQTAIDLRNELEELRTEMDSGAIGPTETTQAPPSALLTAGADVARPILPTEAINPISVTLDNAPVSEILEMMTNEDRRVVAAVRQEKERIEQAVEIITEALRAGGRLIFVGTGTSGRLGALEAIEMPPTFGTLPHVVRAIVPGGHEEVFRSETEDRYADGVRSIARLRVSKSDAVVGISASGTTPFVRGALTRTRKTGAKMILVTCWAGSDLQTFVDVMIAPVVGPEIIAGSTRLKAGTATKMVLNMLTTASMVRLGKTYGNLMVDVQTKSDKLKDRARRIFIIATGLDLDQADELLRRARWNVKAAIVMQKLNLTYLEALERLRDSNDSIRVATGEDIESRLRDLLRDR